MTENSFDVGHRIGALFDNQAEQYIQFADGSYTWNFLEKPAFDRYIPDLYNSSTKALDIGCGTGRIIKHLSSRGLLAENIIGIDVSLELLKCAKKGLLGASFVNNSSEELPLISDNFDLVTSNMTMHYLDNQALERTLNAVHRVLKTGGTFFFVESDPDYIPERRNPENLNRWLELRTSWGTTLPYFNRDPRPFLTSFLINHGFRYIRGWAVNISEAGKVDLVKYNRYFLRPYRIAARFEKIG